LVSVNHLRDTILANIIGPPCSAACRSTCRLFGRNEAKRRFAKAQMNTWLHERGVTLIGTDLDESQWPTVACRMCWLITRKQSA
jgi:hypothetical protein